MQNLIKSTNAQKRSVREPQRIEYISKASLRLQLGVCRSTFNLTNAHEFTLMRGATQENRFEMNVFWHFASLGAQQLHSKCSVPCESKSDSYKSRAGERDFAIFVSLFKTNSQFPECTILCTYPEKYYLALGRQLGLFVGMEREPGQLMFLFLYRSVGRLAFYMSIKFQAEVRLLWQLNFIFCDSLIVLNRVLAYAFVVRLLTIPYYFSCTVPKISKFYPIHAVVDVKTFVYWLWENRI